MTLPKKLVVQEVDSLPAEPTTSVNLPVRLVDRLNGLKRTRPDAERVKGQRRKETMAEVVARLADQAERAAT